MRNHPSDIVLCKVVALGYYGACITHVCYGKLKYRASFLVKIMQMVVYCEMGRRTNGASAFLNEERQSFTIGTQIRIYQSVFFFGRFEKHCSCTIAEYRTSGTVGVVNYRGKFVGTTNNHFLVTAAAYQVCTKIQAEKEPAACSLHIKCKGIGHAKPPQDYGACGRQMIVGG